MTHFEDLTPHIYTLDAPENGALNIGWLGAEGSFPQGRTSTEFRTKLAQLCQKPIHRHRGFHVCDFCSRNSRDDWAKLGNGQIRVRSQADIWYVAPTMIHHYVVQHNYRPPVEFIEAVIDPKLIGDSVSVDR